MADPVQTTTDAVEIAKVGGIGTGGAGIFFLLSKLAERFFKKEDAADAQMMTLLNDIKAGQVLTQASVVTLSSDVRLLTDRGVRSDAEQAQMRAELSELKLKFAKFEGRFDQHLSGQVVE